MIETPTPNQAYEDQSIETIVFPIHFMFLDCFQSVYIKVQKTTKNLNCCLACLFDLLVELTIHLMIKMTVDLRKSNTC